MSPENLALLQEVNLAATWFAARKTKPLWARRVGVAQAVSSPEGELEAKPGDFLCKGVEGELWVQAEATLRAKYAETGQNSTDAEGLAWQEYAPRPEGSGVMAVQISHPFEVHSSWGILVGKPGDYLLKREDDRDVEFPADVWTVDRTVFESTYQRLVD